MLCQPVLFLKPFKNKNNRYKLSILLELNLKRVFEHFNGNIFKSDAIGLILIYSKDRISFRLKKKTALMKNTLKINRIRHNKMTSALRLFYVVPLVFVFSGVFAQRTTTVHHVSVSVLTNSFNEPVVKMPQQQTEILFWLMGSKQIYLGTIQSYDSGIPMCQKRQFLNSGMKPNRILSRSFLKKAINYESTVV